jgi:hypothetical protein
MKTVVVEIRGRFAALLADDGRIVKVRNQNYAIGQVIMMKETAKKPVRIAAWAAAAAAAVCLCAVGVWAYTDPYANVSLDVNPSIEYTLNRFERVLQVRAVNDDGEEAVENYSLDNLGNKSISDAIALSVQAIENLGYFEGEDRGAIMIAVSAGDMDNSQRLAEKLRVRAENTVNAAYGVDDADENDDDESDDDEEEDKNIPVEAVAVGFERVQEARALNVTPGKLNLVEKLRDSATDPDDVDINEWLGKPVREIMTAINTNKAETRNEEKVQKQEEKQENRVYDTNAPQVRNEERAESRAQSKAEAAESKAERNEERVESRAESKAEKAQSKAPDEDEASLSQSSKPQKDTDKGNSDNSGKDSDEKSNNGNSDKSNGSDSNNSGGNGKK